MSIPPFTILFLSIIHPIALLVLSVHNIQSILIQYFQLYIPFIHLLLLQLLFIPHRLFSPSIQFLLLLLNNLLLLFNQIHIIINSINNTINNTINDPIISTT